MFVVSLDEAERRGDGMTEEDADAGIKGEAGALVSVRVALLVVAGNDPIVFPCALSFFNCARSILL